MLRVIQAFGDRVVGDSITEPSTIAEILESEQAAFVVTVDDPAPPAKPKPDTASAS
jgi:hypothetical protein